jgi:hypothetical protein
MLRIRDATDLRKKVRAQPSILLSVSIPYKRPIAPDETPEKRRFLEERNQAYLDTAEPVRIRSAVIALTRTLLLPGVRLVFGAHPSISPTVLDTARDIAVYHNEHIKDSEPGATMRSVSATDAAKARVLIFQSAFFESELPKTTLQLATWDAGVLVLTPAVPDNRATSLTRMRELMVSVPGLRAGIFIGGMEGVEEEAQLFRQHAPGKPTYAIASTGSAARKLWNSQPDTYSGTLASSRALSDNASYTVLGSDILADLDIREEHR